MQDFSYIIQPGVGMGPLRLGSTQAEVLALLGEPTTRKETVIGDDPPDHNWNYEDLEIDLSFSPDDDYLLGTISTESLSANLNWQYPVGMTEGELLRCDFGGLGPPRLDDDFEECGKDFVWDGIELSCWVLEGMVDSITIFPNYDKAGLIPIWPLH